MATRKKKRTVTTVQSNKYLYLSVVGFVFAFLLGAFFYASFAPTSVNPNADAANRKTTPDDFLGNCVIDPNSTDRTPPTIEVVNPLNGSTIPTQTAIDNGTASRTELKIIVRDNEPPYGGQQARAWVVKNGTGGSNLVPSDPYPYYSSDENGYYMNYHNIDGIVNPKIAGKTVTYSFGACDMAGNKTYTQVSVTTSR